MGWQLKDDGTTGWVADDTELRSEEAPGWTNVYDGIDLGALMLMDHPVAENRHHNCYLCENNTHKYPLNYFKSRDYGRYSVTYCNSCALQYLKPN
jgi:hypothetical protein